MDWLHWWYNHATHLVSSSTTLALKEKHKSTSTSAIQVKNRWTIICTAEKLGVISRPEKGERIVDICYYGRLAHISVRTIRDNADRLKKVLSVYITLNAKNLKQGVFV